MNFHFLQFSAEQFRKEALWGALAFPAGLTRAMDWIGLEPIGAKFIDHVKHFFRDPSIFYVAVETEDDVRHVLQEAFGSADLGELGEQGIQIILKWKADMLRPFQRMHNRRCLDSFGHLRHPGQSGPKSVQDHFEELVRDSPAYVLDLARKQLKRKRESKGTQRADLEKQQRDLYALHLAEILQEACLPVTFQISALADPNRAWIRIFGSRRSKTLRNRYRSWSKFRSWYIAFSGLVWPKTLVPLVAYVEEHIQEGCTFSFPSELHAALTVLEQIGRVPDEKRISNDVTWMSHLASWKLELESNARAPKQAKPYTVAVRLV